MYKRALKRCLSEGLRCQVALDPANRAPWYNAVVEVEVEVERSTFAGPQSVTPSSSAKGWNSRNLRERVLTSRLIGVFFFLPFLMNVSNSADSVKQLLTLATVDLSVSRNVPGTFSQLIRVVENDEGERLSSLAGL